MELKEPAKCCGVPTLIWFPERHLFICPCGKMKVTETGRLLKDKPSFNHFFTKKKEAT